MCTENGVDMTTRTTMLDKIREEVDYDEEDDDGDDDDDWNDTFFH